MSDRWAALAAQQRKPETLVVNLYGGPGTGKSTTAALLYGLLKTKTDLTVELVTEFAKDLVWEQRHSTLQDQVYILGKQQHRVMRLLGQVDVIVTDAPIMLAPVYSNMPEIDNLAFALHNRTRSLDVFLKRDNEAHPYNERGRYQNLNGAEQLDREIAAALQDFHVTYFEVPMDGAEYIIADMLLGMLRP